MSKQTYTVTVEPAKSGGGRYVANISGPMARWELGMGATPEDDVGPRGYADSATIRQSRGFNSPGHHVQPKHERIR